MTPSPPSVQGTAEAKLSSPRRFYFLPPDPDLGLDGELSLSILDHNNEHIPGSPFPASLLVSPAEVATVGVYEAGPVSFPGEGAFLLVWSAPGIKHTEQITVLQEPLGDFSTQVSRKFYYTSPDFEAVGDVVLRVIKDGEKIGPTYSTSESASLGVYETSEEFLLSEAGTYLFLWTSESGGYEFTKAETWLVLPSPSKRLVSVFVVDVSTIPEAPQVHADVLVSLRNGTPLLQRRTDSLGKVQFLLADGKYVVSVRKSGFVYSRNNLEIEVSSPSLSQRNEFYLIATPFPAAFDPMPLFGAGDTSKMMIDLSDMRGRPLVGVRIFVSNRSVPDKKEGLSGRTVGLFGEPLELLTDGNGHAEVVLLRGQRVTVAIEGTTIRRTITVPDQEEFSFLDLVTSDDDPFDVMVLNIPAAERRS